MITSITLIFSNDCHTGVRNWLYAAARDSLKNVAKSVLLWVNHIHQDDNFKRRKRTQKKEKRKKKKKNCLSQFNLRSKLFVNLLFTFILVPTQSIWSSVLSGCNPISIEFHFVFVFLSFCINQKEHLLVIDNKPTYVRWVTMATRPLKVQPHKQLKLLPNLPLYYRRLPTVILMGNWWLNMASLRMRK